jgi:hypothetical protein
VDVPKRDVPLKNSTLLMVPLLTEALALRTILAGAVYEALLAGELILTVGGSLTVPLEPSMPLFIMLLTSAELKMPL